MNDLETVYVVDYIDERNRSVRTAEVAVPLGDIRLMAPLLTRQGKRIAKILRYHPKDRPEEVTQWR